MQCNNSPFDNNYYFSWSLGTFSNLMAFECSVAHTKYAIFLQMLCGKVTHGLIYWQFMSVCEVFKELRKVDYEIRSQQL